MIVAGVVVETAPGAAARVAARLAARGLEVAGGDGASRVAAVCEAADGAALEALAERILAEDEEVLGLFPSFIGQDDP